MLIVEKEASFQRLLDGNVLKKLYPCIVITVSRFQSYETSPNSEFITEVFVDFCHFFVLYFYTIYYA